MFVASLGYTARKRKPISKTETKTKAMEGRPPSHLPERILGYSEFTGIFKETLRARRPFKLARSSPPSTSPVLVALFLIRAVTPLSGHSKATGPCQSLTSSPVWHEVGSTKQPVHSGRGEAAASTLFFLEASLQFLFVCLISFSMPLQG